MDTYYSSKKFVDVIEVVANTPDVADTSQEMADFKIGSRVLVSFTCSLHAYDNLSAHLVKDQGFSRPRNLRIRKGVLKQDWVENMAQTSTSQNYWEL